MTCSWCGGEHPDSECHKSMTVDKALRILGPIRAARSIKPYRNGKGQKLAYWLDGKKVMKSVLLCAAIRKVRDGEK